VPIDYRYDATRGIVFARGTGVLVDDDVSSYVRGVLQDPEVRQGAWQLLDCTDVTAVDVTPACVRRIAASMNLQGEKLAGSRLAILAPGDAAYGMGRMYQALRDGGPGEVQVFRERAEAEAWLDPSIASAEGERRRGGPDGMAGRG
jgi:hypothetical protein